MPEEEGTGEGLETGTATGQNEVPAWISQLPVDLKGNDVLTGFKTLGDLSKSYLDLKGKTSELDGVKTELEGLKQKLPNAIFKPGEQAAPEEIDAYHKALGIPEKATEYEFPKPDGVEHDPKMVDWAQKLFHAAKLTKESAAVISQGWDTFIDNLVEEQEAADAKVLKDTQEKLNVKWGVDYKTNIELSTRAFKALTKADSELAEYTVDPILIEAFYEMGKIMGEDTILKSTQSRGSTHKPGSGFVYDNTPS